MPRPHALGYENRFVLCLGESTNAGGKCSAVAGSDATVCPVAVFDTHFRNI